MALLTHASFFSGVGGMDIGLERAGWQTVSVSEIEPYPCAVLAERWPDVRNLGDITRIEDVPDATLWTGGFPCQDLSVAGQRKGFTGERSVLAFTFLDLVERHRPEAFMLENVPGLLSSNAGRDFGRLLREVGDLGYGWAYRILDAQWFGVPQRRRRVFILALDLDRHSDPDSAGEVLAVGTSCRRDHAEERQAWTQAARRTGRGAGIVDQAITCKWSKQAGGPSGDEHHHLVYGPPPNAAGVRTSDGMAGRMDDLQPVVYVKGKRAMNPEDFETGRDDHVAPTLNGFDVGDTRATTLVSETGVVQSLPSRFLGNGATDLHAQGGWLVAATLNSGGNNGGFRTEPGEHVVIGQSGGDDAQNPAGLDSNRYRAIGNGVASPVAEWIGRRLADYLARHDAR